MIVQHVYLGVFLGVFLKLVCEVWLCLADEVMQGAYDLLPMSHFQL